MRLDQKLVDLGLAATRARARDLVKRGFVQVCGITCEKPSREIVSDAAITLAVHSPDYVSRGAEKLVAVLDAVALPVDGAIALDIGASTGGFTEVLLRGGAQRVYAVDVGTGQLHERLRADPRVINLEKVDARLLTDDQVPEAVDIIVADLSFISLTKALSPAMALAKPGASLIVLVKPQFEAGPSNVGKGGIVRDEAVRCAAVEQAKGWLESQSGWQVVATVPSPITGGDGNREVFLVARRDG